MTVNMILYSVGSFFAGVSVTIAVIFLWAWLRSEKDFKKLERREAGIEVDEDA